MNLTPLQGLSSPALAERYRQGDAQLREWFGSHPSIAEDWRKRALQLDRTEGGRADKAKLASVLRDYQARLLPSAAVDRSIDALAEPGSLAVVGGQQAGLFGGALLIAYKAIAVIQAARHAESLLGRKVVPVFWIAGEDHDFDEANHLYVAGPEGKPRRVRLDRPEGARHSVSRTSLSEEQWQAAFAGLANALPDTEFKPGLIDKLRSYSADSPSLTLAFARLLSDWFGSEGLVLLDADDPALRKLESPMFRRLIEDNEGLERAIKRGEDSVSGLGYSLQAPSAQGCANLFVHSDGGRLLLFRERDGFTDKKQVLSYTGEQLLALAEEAPDTLSNNALSRPLMQEYVLPVLATVLGPSELAYWAGLRPAFERFSLELPILIPRQSFTYLEPGVGKLLSKYEVTAEDIVTGGERLKDEWLEAQDDWQLDKRFAEARAGLEGLYAPLLDTLTAIEPALGELGVANRQRLLDQIAYLEKRAADTVAKQHDVSLRQWDRMRDSLWPLGKPQERALGTLHFLNRYGPDWLKGWLNVPFDALGGHRLAE
ncbi:bacillithiol biosynthesis cysteine-adding enzyme BshC [Cohnella fermenti]|nr:bacillithiol biosynthesis cysteine-adding enzyme BshC [Cohnella fermenti]